MLSTACMEGARWMGGDDGVCGVGTSHAGDGCSMVGDKRSELPRR
jgi:hypothetical protein